MSTTVVPVSRDQPLRNFNIDPNTRRSDALGAVAILAIALGALIALFLAVAMMFKLFLTYRVRHSMKSKTPSDSDLLEKAPEPIMSTRGDPTKDDVNPNWKSTIRHTRSWKSMKSWKTMYTPRYTESTYSKSQSIYSNSPTKSEMEEEYIPPRRFWKKNSYGGYDSQRSSVYSNYTSDLESRRMSSYSASTRRSRRQLPSFYSVYKEEDELGEGETWDEIPLPEMPIQFRPQTQSSMASNNRSKRWSNYSEFGTAWIQESIKRRTLINPLPSLPGKDADRTGVREAPDLYQRYWKHPLSGRRSTGRITFFG